MTKKTVVVALGGNALLKRSEPMTATAQRANVRIACKALAPLADKYNLVIAHGNGPQVGLLALQAAAYVDVEPYPLDVLGAQTQGMIAYMVEQELGNLLPFEKPLATILTMVEVDPNDPAFDNPSKFVGPCYDEAQATELITKKGRAFKKDGATWRRVVASPKPKHIFELAPIRWLMEKGTVVICAGGGGIPTVYTDEGKRTLVGIEAVIDKDLAGELLAEKLEADVFVMATDAQGVYLNWETPEQELLGWVKPEELGRHEFAAGSMGPKVEAAIKFALSAPGKRAAVGRLEDIEHIVEGRCGTNVTTADKP